MRSGSAFRKRAVLLNCGGLLAAAVLLSACQLDEQAADSSKPAAATASTAPAPAPATTSSPAPRAKPDFGGVQSTHVEAAGEGVTLQEAIDDAIHIAIEQVNGKVSASGAPAWSGFTPDDAQMDLSSPAYAAWLSDHTAGAVTKFRVLSQKKTDQRSSRTEKRLRLTGEADASQDTQQLKYQSKHAEYAFHWEVRIAADVATYREAAGAKLTRVVVAMPRMKQASYRVGDSTIPADAIAQQIRANLTDALTQTHRFTVLDRDASEEIGREIELIQSGAAKPADTARLGQQLATDLIVIPTIDRFEYLRHERALRMSDRTLASFSGGGALSFRVVNAVTGQVVMSQSFDYQLPATAPTTLGVSVNGPFLAGQMMNSLDRAIIAAILRGTYPLSVVQLDGRNVVINQGGDAIAAGQHYQAVRLGKEVIDPQSGASLGATEQPCCVIAIDRVTPNLTYGHVIDSDFVQDQPFTPGSIELRDPAAVVAEAPKQQAPTAKAKAKVASKAKAADSPEKDANW